MSAETLVIFDGDAGRWLRIADDAVVAHGKAPIPPVEDSMRVVGVVSAADTIVHVLAIPGLADAQARAAARLALADASLAAPETLHVAVGPEADGARTVLAIDAGRMTARMADWAEAGFDPDAVISAALVPPRPAPGMFVRADLGDYAVVRGTDAAFADDPVLTPLLATGPIETLSRGDVEAALIAASAHPEVDLRQGGFALRRRWMADASHMRRIGWLVAACLATLLLVPIALLINLNWTAGALEARTRTQAQAVLPPGAVVMNPMAQLDARLGAIGLQGGGFLSLAGLVSRAVEATANTEIGSMSYTGDGGLKANIRANNPADVDALVAKLSAAGVIVSAGPVVAGQGAPTRELTVRRP